MKAKSEIQILMDELECVNIELRNKSNEITKKLHKYDYVVQIFQGEWFNIFCSGNYLFTKAVMDKSECKYTRIYQIY